MLNHKLQIEPCHKNSLRKKRLKNFINKLAKKNSPRHANVTTGLRSLLHHKTITTLITGTIKKKLRQHPASVTKTAYGAPT